MTDRIKEVFDGLTIAFGLSAGGHFATIKLDAAMSFMIGVITIVLGFCKLYEFFSGKKVSDLFKKEKP